MLIELCGVEVEPVAFEWSLDVFFDVVFVLVVDVDLGNGSPVGSPVGILTASAVALKMANSHTYTQDRNIIVSQNRTL